MLDSSGERSNNYLYCGDEVAEGFVVPYESVAIPEIHHEVTILKTRQVCVKGISYKVGDVLLLTFADEPEFVKITDIIVAQNRKFFICIHLNILSFCSHMNSFSVEECSNSVTVEVTSLVYKWPQIAHAMDGGLFVMLYNCDEVWAL